MRHSRLAAATVLVALAACSPGDSVEDSPTAIPRAGVSSPQGPTAASPEQPGRPDEAPPADVPPAGQRSTLVQLRMFSGTSGWLEGFVRDVRHVFRTADGGRTWEDVSPPVDPARFGFNAFFLDAERAWSEARSLSDADDALLLRTSDGGRSWATIEPSGRFSGPRFVDLDHGWSVEGFAAAGPKGAYVHRSEDGGRRWFVAAHAGSLPEGETLQNLTGGCDRSEATFASARTAWVTGFCLHGPPNLAVTHDGGRTWRSRLLPEPPGYTAGERPGSTPGQIGLRAPAFATSTHGFMVADRFGADLDGAALYATTDAGRTWTVESMPGPGQADFVGPRDGWLLTPALPGTTDAPSRRLYRTTDAGRSWALVAATGLVGEARVDFVTGQVGFAVVDGYGLSVLRTDDAGQTWARLATVAS